MEQFLGLLRSKPLGFYNVPELLRMLMRACQVRARSDPRGFAEVLFAEMAAFNGFLLLRTQLRLAGRVASTGEGTGQPGIVDLSQDVTERLLPALAEMQRGLGEVLAAQAATARMWALADARRAANGDEAGTGPSRAPRARTSDAPEAGRKRRHASDGKAAGTTNGKVAEWRARRTARSPARRTARPRARRTAWVRAREGGDAMGDARVPPRRRGPGAALAGDRGEARRGLRGSVAAGLRGHAVGRPPAPAWPRSASSATRAGGGDSGRSTWGRTGCWSAGPAR